MKVLAIGNSFSQDATRYLHAIAAADGTDLKVVNLYIGGCSLERHRNNIRTDAKDYEMELNGESTGTFVSVAEALASDDWDIITLQQASHFSGLIDTYEPYLGEIVSYLRRNKPNAEILMHETWAYEIDSNHSEFVNYGRSQKTMYEMLSAAYRAEAQKYGLRLIPCGDVIQTLRKKEPFRYEDGGLSVCRDGFHMDLIYGRYLLAAVWYKALTGRSPAGNTYVPAPPLAPNTSCDKAILRIVKETADAFAI